MFKLSSYTTKILHYFLNVCVDEWVYVSVCVCVFFFFRYIISILLCFNILTTFEIFTGFFYQKYISFHVFCLHLTSILHLFMHLLHFSCYFFCFTHFFKIQITVLFSFVIFFTLSLYLLMSLRAKTLMILV